MYGVTKVTARCAKSTSIDVRMSDRNECPYLGRRRERLIVNIPISEPHTIMLAGSGTGGTNC